jgi:hypothetical protein
MIIAGIAITIKCTATAIVICAILIDYYIRTGGFWQTYCQTTPAILKLPMKNYWKGDFFLNIVRIKYLIKRGIYIIIVMITAIWQLVT